MKTAIYIEDGLVQLVITPENDFEKNALSSFENKELRAEIKVGQFYACQGGWVRHQDIYNDTKDRSLILTQRIAA